jgi:hypothetical protein
VSSSIEHLDFDPYSFAESCSRLTLSMQDLERSISRSLAPTAERLAAGLAAFALDLKRERRRLELRAKRERRRRRQQAGQRR